MKFSEKSWLKKPAFLVLSVFDFSLKTIWEAKKSRAIPAYFPSSASSLCRLQIQQALTYTARLSNQVTLSICLFMFRNSQ